MLAADRRRIALLLEYDGSAYAGSQLQKNALTVQSVLERAIEKVTGERSRLAFAGRTDAGVHAFGQVASFLTSTRLAAATLRRALNALLPRDVVVREATDVAADFDARRRARRRFYRYVIDNGPVRPALDRERIWHVRVPLDCPAMAAAAQALVGRHEFAAFASSAGVAPSTTTRDLYCFEVRRSDDRVLCDVVANAFLPHQVRRMVGALVAVGRGRRGVASYRELLGGPPASAGPTAPPRGLYLMQVEYDEPLFGPEVALSVDQRGPDGLPGGLA